jgi:hypothetical protein
VDRPLPWLRYVDADKLDNDPIDFNGLRVESPTGEHLGDVDGFIVDSSSSRPYYVVVDAGGWFKSKHFLLPVGHTRFDADKEVLEAGLTRDRVERFPGFDKDEFDKQSDVDWKRFNDATCQACTITGVSVVYSQTEPYEAAWERADFHHPDWWHASFLLPDRMGESGLTSGVSYPPLSKNESVSTGREHVVASESRSNEIDPSPHFDGRAQPGDVIGVETGGERTYVGDTADDENKRRRSAEEAARHSKG